MPRAKQTWRLTAAWVARLPLSQRLRALWILAGLAWLIFGGFRAVLLGLNSSALAGASSGEIARSFLVGMRYDAMPIGYAALPLALALSLAPDSAFGNRWFRRVVCGYAATAIVLVILVELVGAWFFQEFGQRLNWLALDYLGEYRELAAFIWHGYPVIWVTVALLALLYGLYRLFDWVFWLGRRPRGPIWVRPVGAAALAALGVLGCRGGLDPHPLRMGPAYFSQNTLICQLALNNVFTLTHAVRSRIKEAREFNCNGAELPPPHQAAEVTAQLLLQEADQPLATRENPLWRASRGRGALKDYNVVVIVMEGMAGRPVGALGHAPSFTPRFDALCREGLFLPNMYAVGNRTSHGMVGLLCGHPDLGAGSLMKRSRSVGRFLALPTYFRQRGYRTLLLYGGNPDFDNMQAFFKAGGIDEFIGLDQLEAGGLLCDWGAHDEVVLAKAHETFAAAGDENFFAVILTVSNHRPFEVPAGRVEHLRGTEATGQRYEAYRYADWALGKFFDAARTAEYFRRTLFVLVADHGRMSDWHRPLDAPAHRVPCLFYAPGIISPGRVETIASQTDVSPTLLGLLGGRYEHCFMGRNVLAVLPADGFALLQDDQRMAFVRPDLTLVLMPSGKEVLYRTDPISMEWLAPRKVAASAVRQMRREMLCLYRTAWELYATGGYRPPQGAGAGWTGRQVSTAPGASDTLGPP